MIQYKIISIGDIYTVLKTKPHGWEYIDKEDYNNTIKFETYKKAFDWLRKKKIKKSEIIL